MIIKKIRSLFAGKKPLKASADAFQISLLTDEVRYYRTLINCIHEDIFVIGRDFRIADINNSFLRSSGYTRDDVVGQFCYQVSHGLDAPCAGKNHLCPHAEVLSTGKPVQVVHRHKSKLGGEKWVNIMSSPLRDSKGEVIGVIEAVRDITDVITAQKQFRESEIFLNSVLEQSPVSTCIVDREGTSIQINQAFRDLFKIQGDSEIVGKYDIFEDNLIRDQGLLPLVKSVFEQGRLVTFRMEYDFSQVNHVKISESRERLLDFTVFPVKDSEGLVEHAVIQHRDITEEKKLQDQLLQSQKMESVGTLAGGIAHDFNNILTGIIGFGQLALMDIPEDHPLHGDLRLIEKQALKAADLTRQILAFSRKQTLELKSVAMNQVIKDLSKMLHRIIGEDIELRIRTYPDLPTVHADAAQIEQVIMNLCVNARDAMPQGGFLSLETKSLFLDEGSKTLYEGCLPGAYVLLTVSDTGDGMDPVTLPRIFEPFFTTKDVGRGTGLGLSLVYGIIQQHGGFIHVSSEPEVGTIFEIYLPAEAQESKVIGVTKQLSLQGGDETILVAEDDQVVQELTKRILTRYGYSVFSASNGEEALSMFDRHRADIDLVLVDMVMPKLSGREVCRSIRSQCPDMKILIMSGYSAETLPDSCMMEQGQTDFIHKPFRPAALARKIRFLLDGTPVPGQPV